MATFVFDGTENVTISDFDPATDTIVVDGVNLDDVASIDRNSSSFTLALDSGFVLSLSGADLSTLTSGDFDTNNSDIVFGIGGDGNDTVTGNLLTGGQGGDNITVTQATVSGSVADGALVYGNQGNDTIGGGTFDDLRIFGGAGADAITDFDTGSIVYGGLGADTITAATVTTNEGVTLFGGNGGSDADDAGDNITGGAGNDLIYGNAGNDTLAGGAGNDTIFGGQDNDGINGGVGNDQLFGNLGDDTIEGGGGSDSLYGGQGDDTLNITVAGADSDSVIVSGGLGEDTIVVSTSLSDNITIYGGNGGTDTADGDDNITGGAGDNLIYGNAGNDTIIGGAGDNTILGGAGDDSIEAGAGTNLFTGGIGSDTFVGNDVPTTGGAYSTVTDFAQGTDTIDFTAAVTSISTILPGVDVNTYAEAASYSSSLDASGEAIAVSITTGELAGTTFVFFGDDTVAGGDQVIALTGFTGTLTVDDFAA